MRTKCYYVLISEAAELSGEEAAKLKWLAGSG